MTADETQGVTPESADGVTPDATDPADDNKFDAGAREVIRKERQTARDAENKVIAAERKAAQLQKQIDDAARAKAQADEADAEKKGEFERLATERAEALKQRDATLKELQAERDALKERMDARDAEDIATVAAWIKDHKGAVDDFLDFYPGADAPASAQLAWFNATRPKVEKRAADPARGNGRSPEYANGRDSKADEAAMAAGARQNRNRF